MKLLRLNSATDSMERAIRGLAVCQLKSKKCSYRSTVFRDLDDHPGVASKLMSTGGESVKVCQDKCIGLSGVTHRRKPKWILRMWNWTTSTGAWTNWGGYASVCVFVCVCAGVLTAEGSTVHVESYSSATTHLTMSYHDDRNIYDI